MLKWVGMFLIIGSTSVAGVILANRLTERCRLLRIWIAILDIFKTSISYQAELLPDIFQRIALAMQESSLAAPFQQMAERIRFGSDYSVGELWNDFLDAPVFKVFRPEDIHVLKEFGFSVGNTDRQDQMAKILACQERLKFNLSLAETESRKRVSLYRYLGFASGAILVLWLI